MSDLTTAMYALSHFASRANVLGPIELSIKFTQRRDAEYFKAQVQADCKELMFDPKIMSSGLSDRFEICGIKIHIENDR